MLDFELYSIYTEDDERRGSDKEYFYTYDSAYEARMKYANWFCYNGDVWIRRYDKSGRRCLERWHINKEGNITQHYLLKNS